MLIPIEMNAVNPARRCDAASIEKVTAEEVQTLAKAFFDTRQIALTVLGNLDGFKITRERLDCN